MAKRYIRLFKSKIFYLLLLIALVVVSSITKGRAASITSVLAGIAMIYAAATFIFWIIKTPVKKAKDEAA